MKAFCLIEMEKLNNLLSQLESAVNSPKLYIVNHFDDISSQIDIECQDYLSKGGLTDKAKEKAIQQQEEMISEVDLLQRQCLSNLDQYNMDEIVNLVEHLDRHNLEDSDACLKAEGDFHLARLQVQKLMFMNKGVVFLNKRYCEEFLDKEKVILFGFLVIIEDEFLSNQILE